MLRIITTNGLVRSKNQVIEQATHYAVSHIKVEEGVCDPFVCYT